MEHKMADGPKTIIDTKKFSDIEEIKIGLIRPTAFVPSRLRGFREAEELLLDAKDVLEQILANGLNEDAQETAVKIVNKINNLGWENG